MLQNKFSVDREKLAITNECILDASREKVYETVTNSKLIPKWWGPKFLTTDVDKMDVVEGGKWRFVQHNKDGKKFAFNGVYREIEPNKKLVYTFEYEPARGHILLETDTFEDYPTSHGIMTKLTNTVQYPTLDDLEDMYGSGMETGATESMVRLEELLSKN